MKNILFLCLSIVMVFSILSSCSEQNEVNNTHNSTNNPYDNIIPPIRHKFYFDSTSELISHFGNGFPKEDIDEIERQEMDNNRKGTFRNYVEEIKNKGFLYVPYYKGKEMQLSNRLGSHSILLSVNEGFDNRPIIWFYPHSHEYDDIVNYIVVTYLDDSVSKNPNNRKFSETLREIASPDFPNVDNYEQYKKFYTKIYDSELQLSDRTVKILVSELVNDEKVTLTFIYDNIFIDMDVFPEYLTNGWFKDFSFEKVSLKG